MFADASNFVLPVDNTFIFIVIICVFFLVLITGMMITFVIKYNSKKNKKAKNIHGSVPLEITWTVIPTILVMVMFYFGWTGYKSMTDAPKDSMAVDVYAQMWSWSYKYANGVESDTLFVPLNKPVKVLLHSRDVDHSFYVPAFRIKKDVIPNRTNTEWFLPTRVGSYDVLCAEYCGLRHSYMYSTVVVLPEDQYNKWIADKQAQDNDAATP
ncbi:MAG: cytochrome c oxidase subunit II [Bacteroidetes bacterium]|nr:cytochrome c oxidase subunit II [Bacteroidota bacterium]